ncbi:histamine N-methyltransferase-like [Actinia tenebrosa]|uniref:Histamine N-methyltransferase-like n=1 Tax=Actinia tenebrosa TaxID=6105 RepID=A0A6P8ICB5_ACTTE|nr:histamine N-methyltransferase-like [Actinia tenebrosa]
MQLSHLNTLAHSNQSFGNGRRVTIGVIAVEMNSFTMNTKERYAESFKIFRQKSGELAHIVNILNGCLGGILLRRNFSPTQGRHQLNVLSVGSGSGEADIEILKILNKKMVQESEGCQEIKIHNWVVEPNRYFLEIYEAAIEQLPPSWLKEKGEAEAEQHQKKEGEGEGLGEGGDLVEEGSGEVLFKLLNITFEQFKETNADKKFDIIHFVHSFYYIDMEQALVHCMGKILHRNGFVICIVGDQDSFTEKVIDKVKNVGQRDNATQCKEQNAEKIKKIAEKHKWKYEHHTCAFKFDISEVFDEQSKTGNLLLDFFTHTVDFRFTSNEIIVQETLDLIRSLSFVEDRKYFGSLIEHILFIYSHDN